MANLQINIIEIVLDNGRIFSISYLRTNSVFYCIYLGTAVVSAYLVIVVHWVEQLYECCRCQLKVYMCGWMEKGDVWGQARG
jgi:hypothetical protein